MNRNDRALGSLLENMEKAFHRWLPFKFLNPSKDPETHLTTAETLTTTLPCICWNSDPLSLGDYWHSAMMGPRFESLMTWGLVLQNQHPPVELLKEHLPMLLQASLRYSGGAAKTGKGDCMYCYANWSGPSVLHQAACQDEEKVLTFSRTGTSVPVLSCGRWLPGLKP